jgi:hypothetical protein
MNRGLDNRGSINPLHCGFGTVRTAPTATFVSVLHPKLSTGVQDLFLLIPAALYCRECTYILLGHADFVL